MNSEIPDETAARSEVPKRTVRQRWLLALGGLGPVGHMPASGTVAVAVAGIPIMLLFKLTDIPVWGYLAFIVAFTFVAVRVHEVGDLILGEKDSRKLVLDELPGYWLATLLMPVTWQLVVLSFLLERVIDIAKIPPSRQIEDHVPGGWGVVGDDVMAGVYTLLLMTIVEWLIPGLVGLG